MKGQFTGFYKYDNKFADKLLGREQTFFEIEITEDDGANFYGTVKEEEVGHPGIGTITGIKHGNEISFIKQMPTAGRLGMDGQIKYHNRNHPKLYYSGSYIDDRYVGIWKMKFKIYFEGIVPIITPPSTGTWEMRKK
jgi:hypothetical protein